MAKCLGRFFLSEMMMEHQHFIRQWVGCGGRSNHLPIFLEFRNSPLRPPSPLKFNKTWLKDESFRHLILTNWAPFNPDNRLTVPLQFAASFSQLKGLIKKWAEKKHNREDLELRKIKKDIFNIMELEGGGI